jgi:hypothetical protein
MLWVAVHPSQCRGIAHPPISQFNLNFGRKNKVAVMPTSVNAILSYRATPGRSTTAIASDCEAIVLQSGFLCTSKVRQRRQLIAIEQLTIARKYFGSQIADLQQSHLHVLSDDLVRKLTRLVSFEQWHFRQAKAKAIATIKFCGRNSFPAIGVELWTERRPRFPGGFIELSCVPQELIDRIRRCLHGSHR